MSQPNPDLLNQIYRETRHLPEPIAREVLDYIGFLRAKYGDQDDARDLIHGQKGAMRRVWENAEDEAWNDV